MLQSIRFIATELNLKVKLCALTPQGGGDEKVRPIFLNDGVDELLGGGSAA